MRPLRWLMLVSALAMTLMNMQTLDIEVLFDVSFTFLAGMAIAIMV